MFPTNDEVVCFFSYLKAKAFIILKKLSFSKLLIFLKPLNGSPFSSGECQTINVASSLFFFSTPAYLSALPPRDNPWTPDASPFPVMVLTLLNCNHLWTALSPTR